MLENSYKKYTKEEVLKAVLEYFKDDKLAADVWTRKYCLKDDKHYYELTRDDMHWRLARELGRIGAKYPNPLSVEEIFETLKGFKRIVPQGSPMSGIGNNFQVVSLSNCFVIGNKGESDSYGGVMKLDQELVQLEKRRGGVGVDLSDLRPKGMPTRNSAFTTDGIVVFMERYSNSSREVAQNGRRGALMLTLSVHHPEVMNFIKAKTDLEKVTGANISIRVSDEFMQAVKKNKKYQQRWPVDSENPSVVRDILAREIWDELVQSNWSGAEPGILFWDNILKNSPADSYAEDGFKTISTNPC